MLCVITCYLRCVVDPFKIKEFEHYGRSWIPLVERFGGIHHGYFLPHEGANDIAVAMFSFPSLADYETYRLAAASDAACQDAVRYYEETRCFLSYERTFLRPVFSAWENQPYRICTGRDPIIMLSALSNVVSRARRRSPVYPALRGR
jgi:NIPSNAP